MKGCPSVQRFIIHLIIASLYCHNNIMRVVIFSCVYIYTTCIDTNVGALCICTVCVCVCDNCQVKSYSWTNHNEYHYIHLCCAVTGKACLKICKRTLCVCST